VQQAEEKAKEKGSNAQGKIHQMKDEAQREASRMTDTLEGARPNMGKKRNEKLMQDAAANVKQKANASYDTVASNMPQDPKHMFEEKMSAAYDMLKDGMDMTGLAEAKSKVEPIVNNAKRTMTSVKDRAVKVGQQVSNGVAAAATVTGMNTSKIMPLKELRGVAAYDMIERMEEAQDHPAELNSLRSAEINMYGNDRKLREAVFTWSEDALLQNSNEAAPPKHDIRTAVGSVIAAAPASSDSSTRKNEFDDEVLNALLDEAVDFGATIYEDPRDMLRRKSQHAH
jgi:hypothetical protein